jgi:hypothetical protein
MSTYADREEAKRQRQRKVKSKAQTRPSRPEGTAIDFASQSASQLSAKQTSPAKKNNKMDANKLEK